MGMMTIRNIPDEIHQGLRERAKRNKRSTEAEVRAILKEAIQPQTSLRMGDALAELGREGGTQRRRLGGNSQHPRQNSGGTDEVRRMIVLDTNVLSEMMPENSD